ncbi:hypothetical protein [Demequina zhanjiangensis]|uniref:SipW-cognate class signal peptide n=1 Tax=Demequina zhanjiangensis TaxID=3051659 RepID=A0ABT8FZ22_9MICO|nr:hypothetical protein [Demequina sp. SYSU T00b26]MDN4472012.1 hypothetical protein [Demequina sp. SYSU T00b26]
MTASNEGGVSRRRILQGAAWAAPAIVIATAVPAAANSGTVDLAPIVSGTYSGDLHNNSASINGNFAGTTANISRNDTFDGTYSITEIRVSFTATKWTNGTKDAIVVDPAWTIDLASSDFPATGADADTGVMVIKPAAQSGLISLASGSSLSVNWKLPKYAGYVSVVVIGAFSATGSPSSVPMTTTLAYS